MSFKIAIFGAGATGCYLGASLVQAGLDVSLICRESVKQSIVDNRGVTITDYLGNRSTEMPTHLYTDVPDKIFDLVFVTVKCHQLPSAVESLLAITNPQSLLVFMQNGLGSLNSVKSLLGERKTVQGITPFNVLKQQSAHYRKATEGQFTFQTSEYLLYVEKQLASTPHKCKLISDIQSVIHGKLLLNLNNALNAIADQPIKTSLENRFYRRLLADAMGEWLKVCKALNLPIAQLTKVKPNWLPYILKLPNVLFKLLARSMLSIDPHARSSMWDDIGAKRKTEIEFLNGAVVELGRQAGVKTPVNSKIVQAIHRLEQGGERLEVSDLRSSD